MTHEEGESGKPSADDFQKLSRLKGYLKSLEEVVVAYSGGVDSAFLALVAHNTLGSRAQIVTAVSPSLSETDLARARRIAARFRFNYREINTRELERPDYVANGPDRCYHCKQELFSTLQRVFQEGERLPICYGAIPEDRGDHRPGSRAAKEFSVHAPLSEFELTKPIIRRLSKHLDLETWHLPSQACLASRIAYHTPVTERKLKAVESSEDFLRELGFKECRVRHHDTIARVEIPPERFAEFLSIRDSVSTQLRSYGFTYITLDLGGLRSGSMNEALKLRVVT